MDTRFKLKEVRGFISALRKDYIASENGVKQAKKKAILKTIRLTFDQIWSGITALFIYPVWSPLYPVRE